MILEPRTKIFGHNSKSCRVALVGSHGVGKSTVSAHVYYALQKQGFTVGYIQELARSRVIPKLGRPQDLSDSEFLGFQRALYAAQINEEDKLFESTCYDVLLSDRCLVDYTAYTLLRSQLEESTNLYAQLFEQTKMRFNSGVGYDLV
jgi:thymidylate kinase